MLLDTIAGCGVGRSPVGGNCCLDRGLRRFFEMREIPFTTSRVWLVQLVNAKRKEDPRLSRLTRQRVRLPVAARGNGAVVFVARLSP